jgi:hypothetical protein
MDALKTPRNPDGSPMFVPTRIRLSLVDQHGNTIVGFETIKGRQIPPESVNAVCDLWDEFVPRIHAAIGPIVRKQKPTKKP